MARADKTARISKTNTSSSLLQAYMRNRATLRAFLRTRAMTSFDADEVLQELYVKISDISEPTQVKNPTAYLFKMAANMSLDLMRQSAHRRRYAVRESQRLSDVSQTYPNQEDTLIWRERYKQFADVLDAMPEKQRRIFVMHRVQFMSHKEIADTLGISPKTVEKHMSKALGVCRRKLSHIFKRSD